MPIYACSFLSKNYYIKRRFSIKENFIIRVKKELRGKIQILKGQSLLPIYFLEDFSSKRRIKHLDMPKPMKHRAASYNLKPNTQFGS